MLKVVDPMDDEANSATALGFFGGYGAVRVLGHSRNAMLLERIPQSEESTLEQMVLGGRDDEATRIICEVVKKLHSSSQARAAPPSAIPFQQRSLSLRSVLEKGQVRPNDRAIFQFADKIFEDLVRHAAGSEIYLHGDIHHFNILHSPDRDWLAIDPKGIYGPRTYDYANTLCNPYMHESLVANEPRMDRQASIISELANLDKDLLIQLTFLHAMMAAAWNIGEPDLPYWLACAKTAANLVGFEVD